MLRLATGLMVVLTSSAASAQQNAEPFLGVDPFGGVIVGYTQNGEEQKSHVDGWDVGASVSFVRWLGITGSFGRHTFDNQTTHHALGGARFTGPFARNFVRVFAEALAGLARTSGEAASQNGAEVVLGGGFDLLLVRVQLDYVRVNLNGVSKNNGRVFLGGVVPLCFRGCRETDGLDLSKRKSQ